MFELRINVHSPLYAVYMRKVNRWECPPTKASLYLFASRTLKFYLWKLAKVAPVWLLIAFAIFRSVNACYTSLSGVGLSHELIEYLAMLSIVSVLSTPFILMSLRRIKKHYKRILLQKWFIKYRYQAEEFGEKVKGALTPTVRFVGYSPSDSEIDRICP